MHSLLAEYGESHRHHTNKLVHWICVPLIFFSLTGLVWSIPSDFLRELTGLSSAYVNWASFLLLLVLIYYVLLSPALALGMALFSVLCLVICHVVDLHAGMALWQVCLIVFIFAWIGQFYGHKIEGKKPSFLKDVQFLLIGPAWLMHFIYKKAGLPY